MTAIEIRACVRPLQVEDIAKFELLDSLDIFPGDGRIKLINPLSKSVPINTRNRLSNGWLAR